MGILLTAPGGTNNKSWRSCAPAGGGRGGGGGGGGGGRGAAPAAGAGAAPAGAPAAGGRGGGADAGGRGGAAAGAAPPLPPAAGAAPAAGQRGGGAAGGRGGAAAGAAPAGGGAGGGRAGGATPVVQNTGDLTRYTQTYQFFFGTSNGTSIIGPPWSQLTAYDLNTGKIIWQIPNGTVPGLKDPNTGSQFPRGGVLVTAGGLVLVATPTDRKLRAYDGDNGKVLWEFDLPNVSEGVPAVYQVAGKEYIVFCVGGGAIDQPRITTLPAAAPGAYMVFALPDKPKK